MRNEPEGSRSISAFFYCRDCDVELTEFLRYVPERALSFLAGGAVIERGYFAQLYRPWTYREFVTGRHAGNSYRSSDGDVVAFEAGDYLLNVDDTRHLIAPRASFGCCGLQPRGELNTLCPNGHAIGTIHSDCWAATVLRLSFSRVEVYVAVQRYLTDLGPVFRRPHLVRRRRGFMADP